MHALLVLYSVRIGKVDNNFSVKVPCREMHKTACSQLFIGDAALVYPPP